jgi:hypothetical protein
MLWYFKELPDDTNTSVLRSIINITATPKAARVGRVWLRKKTGMQYVT